MKTCSKCGCENIDTVESCNKCGEDLNSGETKINKLASIPTDVLKQQLTAERAKYSDSAIALMEEELKRREESASIKKDNPSSDSVNINPDLNTETENNINDAHQANRSTSSKHPKKARLGISKESKYRKAIVLLSIASLIAASLYIFLYTFRQNRQASDIMFDIIIYILPLLMVLFAIFIKRIRLLILPILWLIPFPFIMQSVAFQNTFVTYSYYKMENLIALFCYIVPLLFVLITLFGLLKIKKLAFFSLLIPILYTIYKFLWEITRSIIFVAVIKNTSNIFYQFSDAMQNMAIVFLLLSILLIVREVKKVRPDMVAYDTQAQKESTSLPPTPEKDISAQYKKTKNIKVASGIAMLVLAILAVADLTITREIKLEFNDGFNYVGEWKYDTYNGQGTLDLADGDKYIGAFIDGKKNGQGTLTLADGDKYVGEWKDGKKNGQGTETRLNGNKYVGEFRDDLFNGQGTWTYTDGSKYIGEFQDGFFNGQGKETNADGSIYFIGEFKDGFVNGQGTYNFTNGNKYIGEWKDDRMNGQGIYTYANGDKYVGEFKDGRMNGLGTMTYADGTTKTGEWKDEEFVG